MCVVDLLTRSGRQKLVLLLVVVLPGPWSPQIKMVHASEPVEMIHIYNTSVVLLATDPN